MFNQPMVLETEFPPPPADAKIKLVVVFFEKLMHCMNFSQNRKIVNSSRVLHFISEATWILGDFWVAILVGLLNNPTPNPNDHYEGKALMSMVGVLNALTHNPEDSLFSSILR